MHGKTRISFIIPINKIDYFLCPKNGIRGIYCLSCLCVLNRTNFNLGLKFKTVKDSDFIFGIHTRLMQPFHMMPGSSPRNLDRDLYTEINSHFRLSCRGGHSFTNITFLFPFLLRHSMGYHSSSYLDRCIKTVHKGSSNSGMYRKNKTIFLA